MNKKVMSIEQAQSIVKKYLPKTFTKIEKYKNLLLNLAKKDKRKAIDSLTKCLNDISNTATKELKSPKETPNSKITAFKILALVIIVEGVVAIVAQSIIGVQYNSEKSNRIFIAILMVFMAPIVEEVGRIIAAKTGCLKYYTMYIVGYETVSYNRYVQKHVWNQKNALTSNFSSRYAYNQCFSYEIQRKIEFK